MSVAQQDRIHQEIVIKAPRSKVWKALTTPSQFSEWFRARLSAKQFRVGERVNAVSTYPGHEGTAFFLLITEITPETDFAWKWAPGGKSTESTEDEDPFTTVVFELEEIPGGTRVKVTESGFEHISLARRAKAIEGNTRGWELQMQNLHNYAEQNS